MSLKKKLYTIVLVAGILMLLSGCFNLFVVDFFVHDVKTLMDDNFFGYRFKEALENEVQSFEELMRNRTLENETIHKAACQETKGSLDALPFVYEEIGEERYAITWSIRSSYEIYCEQRDKVLKLQPDEEDYIAELYTVYNMQGYLQKYASRLNEAIMMDNSAFYKDRTLILQQMPYFLIAISFGTFGLLFLIVRIMTGNMIGVLSQMVKVSKQIEQNDYSAEDVSWEADDELGQLVHAFNKMKHATQSYIHTLEEMREIGERLYQQELEKTDLERRFAAAQLQLLKSQMNPHFLFNTLNMIARMSQIEDAPVTEEMLVALSNLLRYSLRTTEPFSTLEQEIKVVQDYMYIQKKRFGERVHCEIDCRVDATREETPVFLLQPLVENAVIHGISEKEEGGSIFIRIYRQSGKLFVQVEDTGMGMKPEQLERIRSVIGERESGLGVGLGNIYRRIAAYYVRGEVRIDSTYGEGTRIDVVLGERR